jgi:hypothetical protein
LERILIFKASEGYYGEAVIAVTGATVYSFGSNSG